ncbi:hypothetical protein [Paenibacillus gansuensis]|uniref:Uncharacterized protein n=1 Tax=Paenibacillus gansuensis TaxID=306542 RepID=A0ABW5PIT4_9BACL
MKYEDMTPEQKRNYGFIKLSKQEVNFITQMEKEGIRKVRTRHTERNRPQLRLIVNEG